MPWYDVIALVCDGVAIIALTAAFCILWSIR